MSKAKPVIVNRDGPLGELVLDRAERRNAINGPLVSGLVSGLGELIDDPEVGCILVRGASGFFSAGLDLKDMNASPPLPWRSGFGEAWAGLHRDLYLCPKPLVAAVESYGINAGAALALAADFMVVGRSAFLQVGEVRQGVAAPMNLVWLRLKAARPAASAIALLGNRVFGPELVRLGLAHSVVDDDSVLAAARELAGELAAMPPEGQAATKGVMRGLDREPVSADSFLQAQRLGASSGRTGPLPSLKGEA